MSLQSPRSQRGSITGRSVTEIVDDIGYGRAQWVAILLGGQIYFSEGCVLLVVGVSAGVVAKEWALAPVERAWLVAVVFMGVLVGSSISGGMCDLIGRRIPLSLSLFGLSIAAMLTTSAHTLTALTVARGVLGTLIGIGIPAWLALSTELSPRKAGFTVSNYAMMLFPLGEVGGLAVAWYLDPQVLELDWRQLTIFTSLPLLFISLPTVYSLPESPRWLVAKGKVREATEVLEQLAAWNGRKGEVDCTINADAPEDGDGLTSDEDEADQQQPLLGDRPQPLLGEGPPPACSSRITRAGGKVKEKILSAGAAFLALFRIKYVFLTCTLCLTTAALNFSFYGGLYTFPHVLGQLQISLSPASSLIYAALAELPGFSFGIVLYEAGYSTKQCYLAFISGTLASTLLFLFASDPAFDSAYSDSTGLIHYLPRKFNVDLVLFALCGIKFFNSLGWALAYGFTPVLYPTAVRAAACSFIVTIGRLGAISCPIVYEMLYQRTQGYRAYFYFMLAISALNMFMVAGLPTDLGAGARRIQEVPEAEKALPIQRARKPAVENYNTLRRTLTPPPAA